jgi:mannose-6-phosphate isomerase-like protein (cupin superfamily)
VLGPNEGEHLIRNAGSLLIKVDPSKGSNNIALGTQQVPVLAGIPVHQHNEADEVLFVLEGVGFGILGDARIPIEKGSAVYVPTGVWHGIENPDSELLLLLWAGAAGSRRFFREASSAPGAPPKQLTRTVKRDCPATRDAVQVTSGGSPKARFVYGCGTSGAA